MADQIKVLVHQEDGVVTEVLLTEGATEALQAQENVSYEFLNVESGVAPDELLVKRSGDDLEIFSAGVETPIATIEGYFLLAAPVPLVGAAENGEFYPFVPESGATDDMAWNLEDGESSAQGLGMENTGSPVPWWPILLAGVLLLGGGAAVASRSSSSSSSGGDKPQGEDKVKEAEKALEDAKDAVKDAEDALKDAEADGKITDDEKQAIEDAIKDAEEKLKDAEDKLNDLPEGSAKDELEKDLADEKGKLEDIEVPESNEDQFTEAEEALEDAKDAVKDAEDALKDAEADGKITDDEKQAIEDAIKDAEEKLKDAEDKLNDLPEGSAKDELEKDLADEKGKLEDIEVPESNEDLFTEAEEAVEEAAKAVEEAEEALENAKKDGKITDEEVAELEEAIKDAEKALEDAQDKVDALPDGSAKDAIQSDLDDEKGKLEDIEAPESNEDLFTEAEDAVKEAAEAVDKAEKALEDALADGKITDDVIAELEEAVKDAEKALDDAQGKVDALPDGSAKEDIQRDLNDEKGRLEGLEEPTNNEAAFDEAEQAVADAEQAVKDAEKAIEDAIAGGKITDKEAEALEQAVEDAKQAVEDAQEKVAALPEGTSKEAIQDNLDGVEKDANDLEAPASNEGAFDEAEQAVKDAEDAVAEAEEALADAIADNEITAEEVEELTDLRDAAQDALDDANGKVDALPDGQDKTDLEGRLDDLENITVPEEGIYDQDVAAAEEAVAEAEAADKAAQDALEAAEDDGYITPEEVEALQVAYEAAKAAKEAAQEAVDKVPAGSAKDDFQERLDQLKNIEVPEATDAEGHEELVTAAEEAVAKAEAADQAAQDALAAANEDGYITPEEVEALQDAYEAAKAAKEAAQEAVDKVPAGSDKDGFQERLDQLKNIEVLEATDAEGYEELVADAEAAVAEAEAADQAAQDALAAANEDKYITPEEVEALQDAYEAAKAAKEAAQEAVDKVPAGSDKDGFQERLDQLNNIEVPEATETELTIEVDSDDGTVMEGEDITLVAKVNHPATSDITITLENGEQITIAKGETKGTVTFENPVEDDVYANETTLEYKVEVTGDMEITQTPESITIPVKDSIDITDVYLTATTKTDVNVNVNDITKPLPGMTVRAEDHKGNSAEVVKLDSSNNNAGIEGFGVDGGSGYSGDRKEIGARDTGTFLNPQWESEKLIMEFEKGLTSIEVSWGWLQPGATAQIEFFDEEGNSLGYQRFSEGTDGIDGSYTYAPFGGQSFHSAEFTAVGKSDFVVHSVKFNTEVDYVLEGEPTEIHFEVSTSNAPDPSQDTPIALVQVYEDGKPVGEPQEVELDSSGRGTLVYEAHGDKAITAEVVGFVEGRDGNFEKVNLDTGQAELELIPPTLFGSDGDDVIDTSKVVATVEGETGSNPSAWGIHYENGREGVYIDSVEIDLSGSANRNVHFGAAGSTRISGNERNDKKGTHFKENSPSHNSIAGNSGVKSYHIHADGSDKPQGLTINFEEGWFTAGKEFNFAADTDTRSPSILSDGRNDSFADELAGSTITIRFSDGTTQEITYEDLGVGSKTNSKSEGVYGDGYWDVVDAGDGDDIIIGNSKDEIIIGGAGNDIMTGGGGADTFVWKEGHQGEAGDPARDIITDFSQNDTMDLSDMLSEVGANQYADYISVTQEGDDMVIQIATNGDLSTGVDQVITLKGVDADSLGLNSNEDIVEGLINNGYLVLGGANPGIASASIAPTEASLTFDLLDDSDALGGNEPMQVEEFRLGDVELDSAATQIDLSALLEDEDVNADNIGDYLNLEQEGDTATLSIDRDGKGTAYESTALLELNNLESEIDLEELLNNNQIIY